MHNDTEIPLFPLSAVLFPSSKLPLFIFEERYKKMINDCLSSGNEFGINYFADRKVYQVGCTAVVEELTNRTETGEMNIIAKGVARYKIIEYELSSEGFYVGKIEFVSGDNLNYDKVKMEKAVKIYNDLVELIYKGTVKGIDLSDIKWYDGKRSVSFLMAEKCGLNLLERQTVLEMDKEDLRLEYIMNYFNEVIPKLKEADRISNIIKSDGYIQ